MLNSSNLLFNLLPYRPTQTGLSRYTERLLTDWETSTKTELPPQLRVTENGQGIIRNSNDLPKIQNSLRIRWLQKNALVQHGINVKRLIEQVKPSTIYSPYSDKLLGVKNIRQIITCHDLIPLYFPNSFSAYLRSKFWLPQHFQQANKIIAISRSVADLLIKEGIPSKKIDVVHNGIEYINNPITSPISQNCLVLARHAKNKNIQLALKGFAHLLKLQPNWSGKLVIIGSKGSETKKLKDLERELELLDRIEWLPNLTLEKLEDQWKKSFCLISTSLMEGFNYPLFEAQARGLPTLASRISAHLELHDGISLLFNLNDHGVSLAWQLQNLSQDNSLWQQLSQTGLTHARQFSLEKQTLAIAKILAVEHSGQ